MAIVAEDKIAQGDTDPYYPAKVATAQFYYSRILNRTLTHAAMIRSGMDTLFELNPNSSSLINDFDSTGV